MGIWKRAILGYLGGMAYVLLELLWRGWSHGSMFVVGGLCFLLIGEIGRRLPGLTLLNRAVLGAVVVTGVELVSGLILNLGLGLRVWDYSGYPLNFMGQVCMNYFFLWIWVSAMGALLDGWIRRRLFAETPPPVRLV